MTRATGRWWHRLLGLESEAENQVEEERSRLGV